MPAPIAKTPPTIDREKLRARVRLLGAEYVFYLLDDAIDILTQDQLAQLVARYMDVALLRPDPGATEVSRSLLDDVRAFDTRSRAGQYYKTFNVNSRNYREKSSGTLAFIADYTRILDRCVAASDTGERVAVAAAFDLLFDLLLVIDACSVDVIFFADEHGAWQIGIDWRRVFPAWFPCIAAVTTPDMYAERVVGAIEKFEHYEWDRHIASAKKAGSPAQREALAARAALPRRRR